MVPSLMQPKGSSKPKMSVFVLFMVRAETAAGLLMITFGQCHFLAVLPPATSFHLWPEGSLIYKRGWGSFL